MQKSSYRLVYDKLFQYYGPQGWWPAETAFEMMIGSILVQNTNWRNVDKALLELRPYLQPETIAEMPIEQLAQLIRSSGFFNIKAKRIKSFMAWFKKYGFALDEVRRKEKEELREELLGINGIGRETADVMLIYAFDQPVFVVDAYARRIFYRLGYDMPVSYDAFREKIEQTLPEDVTLYNEYHALLVEHAKRICKPSPICSECPLLDICAQRLD